MVSICFLKFVFLSNFSHISVILLSLLYFTEKNIRLNNLFLISRKYTTTIYQIVITIHKTLNFRAFHSNRILGVPKANFQTNRRSKVTSDCLLYPPTTLPVCLYSSSNKLNGQVDHNLYQ